MVIDLCNITAHERKAWSTVAEADSALTTACILRKAPKVCALSLKHRHSTEPNDWIDRLLDV